MAPHQNESQSRHQQNINHQINTSGEPPNRSSKPQCSFFLGDLQIAKKVLTIFQGIYYSVFISVVTLIALFSDDFRIIFFTVDADSSFNLVTLICIGIFFVEIIVLSFVKENYFFGFYFWLDIISTATMIVDLKWIRQLLTGYNSALQSAVSVTNVARASRASKIGAQGTKLVRIIRIIRFLKLYKNASRQLTKQTNQNQKRVIKEIFSKQSKYSMGHIESKSGVNKRWSRIRSGSSNKLIPGSSKGGEGSLMNVPQGSGSRRSGNSVTNINQKNHGKGSIMLIQHLNPINQAHTKKNHEVTVESNYKIDHNNQNGQSKWRRHNTENIKDLAGFQNIFREFQYSGSKDNQSILNSGSQSQIYIPEQTRVGKKIKDEIQKNLIAMIILLIISIPLFDSSTWFTSNVTSYEKGIYELELAAQKSSVIFDIVDNSYIDFMMSEPSTLIYFSVQVNATCCTFPQDYPTQKAFYHVNNQNQYRAEELLSFVTDAGSIAILETAHTTILTSQLSIGRTLFVCLILVISTLLLSQDIEVYALQPLQSMFETVGKIALNPLGAIRQIEQKNMCIQAMEQQMNFKRGELTEPDILQNLIVKIGGLLAVGFGEAGTQIISKVIQDPEFVNVIIPGQKVMGIYGFCDIRNFTDATEILEADVMVFVNQIAEICHSIVNSHGGSPNKNIGDAFLLVWKYHQSDIKLQQENVQSKNLQLVETRRVKQLADLAVLSFVRMIAQISRSFTLLKYKNNKALKNRIKNYKGVKMGYGLHVGWSIEGPIGSEYKVDASYLSPSVNMASRLEAGTKQYDVPILITEDVYKLMTENRRYLRLIDRVIFQGNNEPTNLYTVDLHVESLVNKLGIRREPTKTKKQKKLQKIKENLKRNKLLEDIEVKYVTKEMWENKDIKIMREKYTLGFYQEWQKGFDAYIRGEWQTAMTVFRRTQIMAPNHKDGPSETLYNFMKIYQGKSPADWKGYREATI